MVSQVITVDENSTVRDLAKVLVANHISAVPVVNSAGKVVGIVSEADLMHRTETGTERPTSWWLSLISGDQALAAEYVQSHARKVKDVMTTDVQTAQPDAPLVEIADMFEEKHVRRVPVTNDAGELIGIVSRANIVQAFASARPKLAISLPDSKIRERLIAELKKQSCR